MIKNDIVAALCEKGYYKAQANEVVDDVFKIIYDALVRGDSVMIRGFGTFEDKYHKGRNSMDITTGQIRVSQDRMVPVFRACGKLRNDVRKHVTSVGA